jgi:hypothetical protein
MNGWQKYDNLIKNVPREFSPQEGWKVTASHTASTRIGGNISPQSAFTYEGWSTGIKQEKGMWYQIEFPTAIVLTEFRFNSLQTIKKGWKFDPKAPPSPPPFIQTYPRVYMVEISSDGTNWQETIAATKGSEGDNVIGLNAVKAKFLRIKLTGGLDEKETEAIPWSMRQVKIFGQN